MDLKNGTTAQIRYKAVFLFMVVFFVLFFYGYYIEHQKSKPAAAALMFHSINPRGPQGQDENALVVTPKRFSQDLKYLKLQGYRFIDCEDLLDLINQTNIKQTIPAKNILITFDDGYIDNYTYAYPVLKQESAEAVINVVVYYIEKKNKPGRDRYLSWSNINEMIKSDIIQIGSHTYDSHHYVKIGAGKKPMLSGRKITRGKTESWVDFEKRVTEDLLKSIKVIQERTGQAPQAIAFPYGWAAPEARKIASDLGFKVQMGIKPGINLKSTDFKNLKRIAVKQSYTPRQLEERIRFYTGVARLMP